MSRNDTRIEWVDILRGIGIVIMVMGHVGFGGKFDRIIHSYHMPLFFVISGFLFKTKDVSVLLQIKHKIKTLLIPYLSFFLINYAFYLFLFPDAEMVLPWKVVFGWNSHGMPIAGALWFLTALFFTEVIYIAISKVIKKERMRVLIILVVAVSSSVFSTLCIIRLPLSLDQGIVGLGFYEIGRQGATLLRSDTHNPLKKSMIRLFISGCGLLVVNTVLSFVNGYVNMKEGWYSIVPLFWLNAIIGIWGWLNISVWIYRNTSLMRKIICDVGKNSIVYVGLNQLIILLVAKMTIPVIGNAGVVDVLSLIGSLVCLLCSMVIMYWLSKLFMNTSLKILCGK